jgi:excisionase family DNA binding protein
MAIELQQSPFTCKHCNIPAPEGSRFCPACGKRIPKPKMQPAIDDQLVIKQTDAVLTVKGVCGFFHISEWKIYDLMKQHKIPFFMVGEHKRFLTSDLIEWARDQEMFKPATE